MRFCENPQRVADSSSNRRLTDQSRRRRNTLRRNRTTVVRLASRNVCRVVVNRRCPSVVGKPAPRIIVSVKRPDPHTGSFRQCAELPHDSKQPRSRHNNSCERWSKRRRCMSVRCRHDADLGKARHRIDAAAICEHDQTRTKQWVHREPRVVREDFRRGDCAGQVHLDEPRVHINLVADWHR